MTTTAGVADSTPKLDVEALYFPINRATSTAGAMSAQQSKSDT